MPNLPLLPPTIFALHLAAMLTLHFGAPLMAWNLGASRWWGLAFVLPALVVLLRSVSRFRGRTTIIPGEASAELVTDGDYRFSRNPMYTALVISLLGAFVLLGTLSPGLAIPSLGWFLQKRFIESEERALEEQFGEAYLEYKSRVRRWL